MSTDSSDTTTDLPGLTLKPASRPPALRRASRRESRVVLPAFHWLVSRVILPLATKPWNSQGTVERLLEATSWDQTSWGTKAAFMVGDLSQADSSQGWGGYVRR